MREEDSGAKEKIIETDLSQITTAPLVFPKMKEPESTPHSLLPPPSVREILEHYIFPQSWTFDPAKKSRISDHTLDAYSYIELCRNCFAEREGRDLFLQALDDKRGRDAELTKDQYEKMKTTMKIFLDKCQELGDVKSALRIANMSITFHTITSMYGSVVFLSDLHRSSSPSVDGGKHYLQKEPEISHHSIWRGDQFWEDALVIGLAAQLDLMERVRWDELDAEVLREKILGGSNYFPV